MRDIHAWLEAYGVSHQNELNILIHKFCVPAITFSILGMLYLIPHDFPYAPYLNPASITCALILAFYAYLSRPLFLGMLLQSALMLGVIIGGHAGLAPHNFELYLGIFIIAWILQFIGHKIEGQKPSFFEDIVFLLIGPLWTLNFFFKKLNIRV